MLSRWMPPLDAPNEHRVGIGALVILTAGALGLLVVSPVLAAAAATWMMGVGALAKVQDSQLLQRAHERPGEDIGTFARAFDRRSETFDSWVIRAAWDALAPWTQARGGRLALRPNDVVADLGCVEEDFDDVLIEIATRARRNAAALASHVRGRRTVTVRDLVTVISELPRCETA